MEEEEEEFRVIDEYPDYLASNFGYIISMKRKEWIELQPGKDPDGYLMVTLCKNGQKPTRIAPMILKTFVEKPEGFYECDHINRNRSDNRLTNLRWVTKSEQNYNRDLSLGVLNEKYIYLLRNGTYQVQIRNKSLNLHICKTFDNLKDAIEFRDEMVKKYLVF